MADTADSDGHELRLALVGVAIIVVAVLVAVAAMWWSGREAADVATDPDSIPSDPIPSGPASSQPGSSAGEDIGGLDGSHPFVGRTELDIREVYPLVRTTWRDGDALPTTMDFVAGRVNLAVSDGEVVAASVECDEESVGSGRAWNTQACDPAPDDGPTVWGKLIAGPGGDGLVLEPGFDADRYYAQMAVSPRSDPLRVWTTSGDTIDFDQLTVGDVVWLWVAPACRESSPVQCDLNAVTVDR